MMRQETTAPVARRIDMLSGTKAPDKFFEALNEADKRLRHERIDQAVFDNIVDDARRLRRENQRLQRDNICLRRQLDALLSTDVGEALTRNEELVDELRDLRDSHAVTVERLATANAAVAHASRRGW